MLRREDGPLLTGRAEYADDIHLPGMVYACAVRSDVAHARIDGIDTGAAEALEGVVGVYTAPDLERLGVDEIPTASTVPGQRNTSNPALARDSVRYVGQPVAVVVADDPYLAEDAAALVSLSLEPLPAVLDVEAATEPGAPLLYPEWGSNVSGELAAGNGCDPELFERAAIRLRRSIAIQRQTGLPLEPRGAVAYYDERAEQTVAWISTQSPHHLRLAIAEICNWPGHRLRVIAPDVGGAFGTKEYPLAEELLTCLLAYELRRPVKWIVDMREHLLSTPHAREQLWNVELAADEDGKLLGLRGELFYDVGGHFASTGLGAASHSIGMLPGPYALPNYEMKAVAVVTNKVPAGAYRGFGVPQANFVMERLMDELADRASVDRGEIRRRNLIAKRSQPYVTAAGRRYDGGDYAEALSRVLEVVEGPELERLRAAAAERGGQVGRAAACYVMPTGLAPSSAMASHGSRFGAHTTAIVRMDSSGRVTVYSGVCGQGQGTATTLAQICASVLGLDAERDVAVVLGDTGSTPFDSAGSISSRVTSIAGASVRLASYKVREKLLGLAGDRLEAPVDDLVLGQGAVFVTGSPNRSLEISALARDAYLGHPLPDGMEPGLEGSATVDPPATTYPYGAHGAIVEVDPVVGCLRILKYVVCHDSGSIVNPVLLKGQIVGGVAQGLGGTYLESLVYDPEGQPLASSLMDYLLPTAVEVPPVEVLFTETPAPDIEGGAKGGAESGIIAPAAVIASAVEDALSLPAATLTKLPLLPSALRREAGGAE